MSKTLTIIARERLRVALRLAASKNPAPGRCVCSSLRAAAAGANNDSSEATGRGDGIRIDRSQRLHGRFSSTWVPPLHFFSHWRGPHALQVSSSACGLAWLDAGRSCLMWQKNLMSAPSLGACRARDWKTDGIIRNPDSEQEKTETQKRELRHTSEAVRARCFPRLQKAHSFSIFSLAA